MATKKSLLKKTDFDVKSFGISGKDVNSIFQKAFIDVLSEKYSPCNINSFDVVCDIKKSIVQIYRTFVVVSDKDYSSKDFNSIKLSDAKKIKSNISIGENISKEINLEEDFTINDIKRLKKKISEYLNIERGKDFFSYYKEKIGELINVKMYRFCRGYDIVKDENNENLIFPHSEKSKNEKFNKEENFLVFVKDVEIDKGKIVITVSRYGNFFLKKIIESKIKEIRSGIVILKKIVRLPSLGRARVVVESADERINPVGACLGNNCSRVNEINKELKNEIVDFVQYNETMSIYIANILGIEFDFIKKIKEMKNGIFVYLDDQILATAIGKKGVNIKLLRLILEKNVEIFKYSEENDNKIDELCNYLQSSVVAKIKSNGFKNISDILKFDKKFFKENFNFEDEVIDEIFSVAKKYSQKEVEKI